MIVFGFSFIGTRAAGEVRYSVSLNLKLDIEKLADGVTELVKLILWLDQFPEMYSLLNIPRSNMDSFYSQSRYIVITLLVIFPYVNKVLMRLGLSLPCTGYTPNIFLHA